MIPYLQWRRFHARVDLDIRAVGIPLETPCLNEYGFQVSWCTARSLPHWCSISCYIRGIKYDADAAMCDMQSSSGDHRKISGRAMGLVEKVDLIPLLLTYTWPCVQSREMKRNFKPCYWSGYSVKPAVDGDIMTFENLPLAITFAKMWPKFFFKKNL